MSDRAAITHALDVYNAEIARYPWNGFDDFERLWVEHLAIHCFIRRSALQNTGFFIGVMHERRRFRASIPVFKTTLDSAEDIFHSVALDQTTIQTELRFLLMRVYNLTAPEVADLAAFSWTRRDSFTAVLERMHAVLFRFALPWLDGRTPGDL